jgi:hypothetical protein
MKTTKPKPTAPKKTSASKTAVRGKYFNQLPKGTNLAIIDPALHEHFPDSQSVNRALRALLEIREQLKAASPSRSSKRAARAA